MQHCRILMADDDPDDRAILQDAISMLDQDNIISFAENGEMVLKILEVHFSNGQIPRLIVLDLNMPKMNGTQTLKALKEDRRFQTIPVIIYSTSINPLEKEKCLHLGAHSYMVKPVSFKESLETAKAFLSFCTSVISA